MPSRQMGSTCSDLLAMADPIGSMDISKPSHRVQKQAQD